MEYIRNIVEEYTFSNDMGISCFQGIGFTMDLPAFKWVKTEIMTLDQADHEQTRLELGSSTIMHKRQDWGAW